MNVCVFQASNVFFSKEDEEWKEFEQKEVDYSGLRLQALQIRWPSLLYVAVMTLCGYDIIKFGQVRDIWVTAPPPPSTSSSFSADVAIIVH